MEQEEEDFVAAGHSDRSSGRHHPHRRHRCPRHGHRHPRLRRPQGETRVEEEEEAPAVRAEISISSEEH